jgi:hypothetical protein
MIAPLASPATVSRRAVLATPLMFAPWARQWPEAFERQAIAGVVIDGGLDPPLTLGLARVSLRPGSSTWAATPGGVRIILVEAGVLAVGATARAGAPITAMELANLTTPPEASHELLLPAGMAMTFGTLAVASVRNPGSRPAVFLDAMIFPEEPRALMRAFTTNEGISFQLLASASAPDAPGRRVIVALDRLSLGGSTTLPKNASHGLVIMYVEAGTIEVRAGAAEVHVARAAASAPYAMPGALQPVARGERREVTAGGVVFLTMGTEAEMHNAGRRTARILSLSVREAV